MKRYFCLFILLLCLLPARAQEPVALEAAAREAAISKILKANDIRTTLEFRFKMTRHSVMLDAPLVSSGHAAFSFPDKVRWEVEKPRPSVYVLDASATTDRRQQTMLRNLSKASDKGLINEEDFAVTVYAAGSSVQVDMVPLRRDLSQLFTLITLMTDSRTGELRSIVLSEAGGDVTEIEISSMSRGKALDDKLFQIQ